MSRAERRRAEKSAQKKEPVYQFTKQQIDQRVKEEVGKQLSGMREEMYELAVNNAMVLLLTLPTTVLMEHYWKKSFRERAPGFIDRVIAMYRKWQDDELDIEELKKKLWEEGGVRFEEDTGTQD